MEPIEIEVDDLQRTNDDLNIKFGRTRKKYPNWKNTDVRLTCFSRNMTILNYIHAQNFIFKNFIKSTSFWNTFSGETIYVNGQLTHVPMSYEKMQEAVNTCNTYLSISFVTIFHFSLESSFRIFNGALNNKKIDTTPSFYKVYTTLFDKVVLDENDRTNAKSVISLLSNIRNVLHYNGIYYQNENREINYKDKKYLFEIGKYPTFISWGLINEVICDTAGILEKIVENDEIKKIDYIEDITLIHNQNLPSNLTKS